MEEMAGQILCLEEVELKSRPWGGSQGPDSGAGLLCNERQLLKPHPSGNGKGCMNA